MTKPYFFVNMKTRLDEEARKVFDAFKIENTHKTVLFYYLMNTQNPEFRNSRINHRVKYFNEDRDRQAYMDQITPTETTKFAIKKLSNLMGTGTT